VRGGFIHLPLLPEQARRRGRGPGLALATMIDAVRLALEVASATAVDLQQAAGAEH
jgi:pyroglutamyl-peptidase